MGQVLIELLEKRHQRSDFDCGTPELNEFLKTRARQHQEKGFSKTWVAVEEGHARVIGFVSVSMGHVTFENADPEIFARLPKHPMPVLHGARLATDQSFQGRGIASLLLRHAANIAVVASESMGVFALELVAKDDDAYQFYLRRGFMPIKGDAKQLYAPISTIKAITRT